MTMTSLKDEWERFKTAAIPTDASIEQYRDMQIAFYGGAAAMLTLALEAADETVSDEDAEQRLTTYAQELCEFGMGL
jgi:hypothetical protein